MHAVDAPNVSLPLFGRERTRIIEQQQQEQLPDHTLMQRAGLAVARLALAVAPHAQRVWVAAGPGNNGGDGLEAALHLHRHGRQVTVTLCGDEARLPADARHALSRAQAGGVNIVAHDTPSLAAQDLAIDALLGMGATRAPQGPLAQQVQQLCQLPCPVLAVDLPTGLDADTGQPLGPPAWPGGVVRAQHTLSLLTLKPGLFTGAGRDHAGRVWFDGLGARAAPNAAAADRVTSATNSGPRPNAWLIGMECVHAALPARQHTQHKGSFGDVLVVGGAAGMQGALVLAAHAALAAGAGRVMAHSLADEPPATDPLRPEVMWRHGRLDATPTWLAANTVVCGCGAGPRARDVLPHLLGRAGRLVLDADALNAVAVDPMLQALLTARRAAHRATVLTPHPLEAARLLGCSVAEVQADRLVAAAALAGRFDCVVLLKGSGTVVVAPGHEAHINATGNAALACAGSGDVLAGWLAGLWSPRRDGEPTELALWISQAAARLHGAAADHTPWRTLRAADLIEALRARRQGPPANGHQAGA